MRKSKVSIIPATNGLLKEFYGVDIKKSVKGIVGILDGTVVGVGGVSYENGAMVLFSDIKDDLRKYKRDIVLGMLRLKEMISTINYPIFAVADINESMAERILTRLGFEPSGHLNADSSKIYWRLP